MGFNPFIKKPDLMKARRVLCVQAHPDDMDISLGGTMLALKDRDIPVHYLTLTDDAAGFSKAGGKYRERADIRKQEQKEAGEILGVASFHWVDFPDAGEWSHHEARDAVIRVIRELRPDFLITLDPFLAYEAHMDHIRTGRAAAEAAMLYNFPHVAEPLPEGYESFELEGVAFTWTNNPNTVIRTTAYNNRKFEAVSRHASQFPGEKDLVLLKKYLTYRAWREALWRPFLLGESLKILPPVMLHCFPEALNF
ncbi:MAG: PIG-L family deacetylase [Spirochaetales bacterium]|nr:PIG-L family deacetylase [Spirochaetales bacterium]